MKFHSWASATSRTTGLTLDASSDDKKWTLWVKFLPPQRRQNTYDHINFPRHGSLSHTYDSPRKAPSSCRWLGHLPASIWPGTGGSPQCRQRLSHRFPGCFGPTAMGDLPNNNGGGGKPTKIGISMFLHHQLDMIFGCIPFPKSPSLKGKRLWSIMKQRILGHTIFGQTHTVYTTINGDKSSNTWWYHGGNYNHPSICT